MIILLVWISPALPQGSTIHSSRAILTNLQPASSSALQGQQISQQANVLSGDQANPTVQPTGSLNLSFDRYIIKYYSNPYIYAQIDCYSGSSKVGEIGFLGPGMSGEVNQIFQNQVLMYFPISQFPDIMNMLRYTKGPLNLQMSYEVLKDGETWLESGEMQQVGATY